MTLMVGRLGIVAVTVVLAVLSGCGGSEEGGAPESPAGGEIPSAAEPTTEPVADGADGGSRRDDAGGLMSESEIDEVHEALAAMLLRRPDLPRGFRVGGDGGCGAIGFENIPAGLGEVIAAGMPQFTLFCSSELVWRREKPPPRGFPRRVETIAIRMPSSDLAGQVMKVADQLVRYEAGRDFEQAGRDDSVGEEARVLIAERPASVAIAWRSGNLVGLVVASRNRNADVRDATLGLARQQQQFESAPSQLGERSYDPEVDLDALGPDIPVYWLGREFGPGEGLAPLRLLAAGGFAAGVDLGNDVDMWHVSDSGGTGIHLMVWDAAAWQLFTEGEVGVLMEEAECVREEHQVAGGRSVTVGIVGPSTPPPPPPPEPPPPPPEQPPPAPPPPPREAEPSKGRSGSRHPVRLRATSPPWKLRRRHRFRHRRRDLPSTVTARRWSPTGTGRSSPTGTPW